jgi:hypothetical protein
MIDSASGYFSQQLFSVSYAVAVRLLGGKYRKSAGGASTMARAKEKLPSPINKILSVGMKGIVGPLVGLGFAFFFPLVSLLSFGFRVVSDVWLENCGPLPFFRDISATFAAWDIFSLVLRRDCWERRADLRFLLDFPIFNEASGGFGCGHS